jgi:hypothetical protein
VAEADLLEEQRRAIFEALQRQGMFYDSPDAQNLQRRIMQQVDGTDQPFTNEVRQNMLADNSDGAASGYQRNQEQINRAMANAGLVGSGLQASALMGAQMQQGMAARQGRREVNTRAQLENYSARERAQTTAMNYLAQQEQAKRQVMNSEVEQRGRMHATGDAANVAAVTGGNPGPAAPQPQPVQPALSAPTPARPQQYGTSNIRVMMNYRPADPSNPLDVRANPFGHAKVDDYNRQVQQQDRDRAYLSQLQADWDSRYGGR